MIHLLGLEKSYRGQRVLNDATLTVNGGESLALVGANGSGKTTTLRCAIGLARPDRGQITIDGIDVAAQPRKARSRTSFLAQRTDFPSTLTVREILRVVADLRSAPAQSVERELSLCGLSRVADRTAGTLSGGERQRVAIAALFIPDVAVYLLDEPTLNLDPVGTGILVDRLRVLRDKGRTVLFSTHVNGEVERLATRVAILREGRFVPVSSDAREGERHISVCIGGETERWVNVAMAGGATRAWALQGKLHAIVGDSALSRMLAQLEHEGARISAFRTETALALALDRVNDEEHDLERPPVDRVDRCTARHHLWRHARWAGADSAGPR